MRCGARVIVLSLLTTRWYLKQKTVCGSSLAGHGRYAGGGIRRRLGEACIVAGQEVSEKGVRAVAIGDPGQAEFCPQAILKCSK